MIGVVAFDALVAPSYSEIRLMIFAQETALHHSITRDVSRLVALDKARRKLGWLGWIAWAGVFRSVKRMRRNVEHCNVLLDANTKYLDLLNCMEAADQ